MIIPDRLRSVAGVIAQPTNPPDVAKYEIPNRYETTPMNTLQRFRLVLEAKFGPYIAATKLPFILDIHEPGWALMSKYKEWLNKHASLIDRNYVPHLSIYDIAHFAYNQYTTVYFLLCANNLFTATDEDTIPEIQVPQKEKLDELVSRHIEDIKPGGFFSKVDTPSTIEDLIYRKLSELEKDVPPGTSIVKLKGEYNRPIAVEAEDTIGNLEQAATDVTRDLFASSTLQRGLSTTLRTQSKVVGRVTFNTLANIEGATQEATTEAETSGLSTELSTSKTLKQLVRIIQWVKEESNIDSDTIAQYLLPKITLHELDLFIQNLNNKAVMNKIIKEVGFEKVLRFAKEVIKYVKSRSATMDREV